MILQYFQKIENLIKDFPDVQKYDFKINIYDENYGSIIGKIFLKNNFKLEFLEVVDTENNIKDKYRYHFMDDKNKLVFRYDNSKHHNQIKTFPHHKHIENKVLESYEPSFFDILSEIKSILSK